MIIKRKWIKEDYDIGPKKYSVDGRHECIFINIQDFYEPFAVNVCELSFHKEQLFEIRQEYFKGMYSFPIKVGFAM